MSDPTNQPGIRVSSRQALGTIASVLLLILGLYASSRYSYLLFHSLVELLSIIIGWSLFIIVWNASRWMNNRFLYVFGTSLAAAGALDLMHTLAYKGLNLFPGYDANLPTQLWIAARFLQSLSILVGLVYFTGRPTQNVPASGTRSGQSRISFGAGAAAGFAALVVVLLVLIFMRLFPVCYIEGQGLTPFKIVSEYIICLILGVSLVVLWRRRQNFERTLLRLVAAALIATILSELAFTYYVGVYDFSNLLGHFGKLAAFYLIYLAVIQTGLQRPYGFLFRSLSQQEAALRESEGKFRLLVENQTDLLIQMDLDQKIRFANPVCCATFGKSEQDLLGSDFSTLFPPETRPRVTDAVTGVLAPPYTAQYEEKTKTSAGWRWIAWSMKALLSESGEIQAIFSGGLDITERKRSEMVMLARDRLIQLAVTHSLDELLRATLDEVELLTGSQIGFFHFVNPDQRTLSLQAWSSNTAGNMCKIPEYERHYPIEQAGVWVDCVRERRPVIHNAYADLPHRKGMPEGHIPIVRELVVPVLRGDNIVAVLGTGNKPDEYDTEDIEMVNALADLAWELVESKRAADQVNRRHSETLAILESIDEPIYVSDTQTYAMLFANKALQKILGPFGSQPCYQYLQNRESPCPFCTNTLILGEYFGRTYTWDHHNEVAKRWYRCVDRAIVWPDGRTVRYEMAVDITERKLKDETLVEQHALLQAIFNTTPGFLVLKDTTGVYREVNQAFCVLHGLSREEIIGRSDFDLYPQEEAILYAAEDAQVIQAGSGESRDWLVTVQGKKQWLHVIKTAVKDAAGKCTGVLSTGQDISARKQAEEKAVEWQANLQRTLAEAERSRQALLSVVEDQIEAEEHIRELNLDLEKRVADRTMALELANLDLGRAARMKDEFLASMSHELRTPLTGILGLSEALQMNVYGQANERQLNAVKLIQTSGQHLLELINDILDLSKVEAGKLDLQMELASLAEVCQASLHIVGAIARKKKQHTSLSMIPDRIILNVDARRLKQMLVNLLSNAVKFTPDNGSLGVEVRGIQAEKQVRITVWDTGIGIAPEDLPKLFKPFVQLDSSLARHYPGTGLGLSLVKGMAALHNGRVEVESTPGKGSRFTIILPWVSTAGSDALAISRIHRALIIDENKEDTEMITRCFKEMGIDHWAIPVSLGAVEKCSQIAPDVVLMSLNLPDKPGMELLAEMKEDERTCSIPIIAMSGENQRAQAVESGAAGCLIKPVTPESLGAELLRVSMEIGSR
jgi:PAS domain S-box-containing protein